MANLTFGLSLQKSLRIIAIIDIVYCFISVVFNTSIFCVLMLTAVSIATTPKPNIPLHNDNDGLNHVMHDDDPSPSYHQYNVDDTIAENKSNEHQHHKKSHEEVLIPVETEIAVGSESVFFFIFATMAVDVINICFELWMCRLLLSASKNFDRDGCKRWWWFRLGMTLVSLFECIIVSVILVRGWFNWLLESIIFYRIYELVLVHLFKNEISSTINRSPIPNSPR